MPKKKKPNPPKIVRKPEKIKNKQKESLAKGILKTLTKPDLIQKKVKRDKRKSNQEVLKLSAGQARNVIELIEVPIMLNPITQPEQDLFPTKYPSVVVFFREKYIPTAIIINKYVIREKTSSQCNFIYGLVN